jgi:hypothetical protein
MIITTYADSIVVSDDDGVKTLNPDDKIPFGFYVYVNDREEYIEHEFSRKTLLEMAVGK